VIPPSVPAARGLLGRGRGTGTRLERSTELLAVSVDPVDVTIRRRYLADGIVYATQDRTRRYGLRPAPVLQRSAQRQLFPSWLCRLREPK